jgi:hypothetical protein
MIFSFILFIYVSWCPTQFQYRVMFVSFSNNTTGATSGEKLTTSRNTWVHPRFSVEFELLNILFSVYSCVDHFCSFIHLLLAIVFSVFRLTASLFGIFKHSCDISIPIVLDFIRLSKRYIQDGVTFSYVYPKWLVPQWVR